MASVKELPLRPSITPGENPAESSSTCAWNNSPVIGDPFVPGGAQGFAVVGDDCWATAAAAADRAARSRIGRNATLLMERWFPCGTMQVSTVSKDGRGNVHIVDADAEKDGGRARSQLTT